MKQTDYYYRMSCQSTPSLLIQLSIPTTLSMLVSNIYNMADTAFVGQLGTSASAAVGIVFGFMAIIQALGFMFGHGAGSILARHLGKKDIISASKAATTGFFCYFSSEILLSCISLLFLKPLLFLLGSTDTIYPYAKTYLCYLLFAAPVMVPTFSLNNLLRYEGKASLGMVGVMSGAILNIILDPIFIFVLDMGIAGAALATCITQYLSFGILLSFFLRGKTQSKISIEFLQLTPGKIADITTTGMPSLLRQVLNSLATILLNQKAGVFGDAAVAGMSITGRVIFFVFAISLGIGQGFQPISSFSYGAGKFKRLKEAFFTAVLMSETVIFIAVFCVYFQSESIIRLFRNDPDVITVGVLALKLQLIAQLPMPACMLVEMLFQSNGKKLGASVLSSCRSGLMFIPALFILYHFRGLAGIQEAQPAACLLACIPAAIMGANYIRALPDEDSK